MWTWCINVATCIHFQSTSINLHLNLYKTRILKSLTLWVYTETLPLLLVVVVTDPLGREHLKMRHLFTDVLENGAGHQTKVDPLYTGQLGHHRQELMPRVVPRLVVLQTPQVLQQKLNLIKKDWGTSFYQLHTGQWIVSNPVMTAGVLYRAPTLNLLS